MNVRRSRMKFPVVQKDFERDKNKEDMKRETAVEIKATDKKNNDDKDRRAPIYIII